MQHQPLDLTIAIPVKNEESNLPSCLEAIGTGFASRVVVIDSFSSDATPQIARDFDVDIVNFRWDGYFPKKRNWFLKSHQCETTWILFLDADEILTTAVKDEISSSLPNSLHQGFMLTYTNYFLGHRLRGGYPLRKVALFRVGIVEYENIEEQNWSQCDMEVHEHPLVTGSVGVIKSPIDHRDCRSFENYILKHNEYASWEAHRLLLHRRAPAQISNWKLHQRYKYKMLASPWGGLLFFIGSYFIMGGWRDGGIGFAFCFLKSSYFVQVACRFRELGSPLD